MRLLTVRQPWAWSIILAGKDVENRSKNLAGSYRGPVAIHAAKGRTAEITDAQEQLLLEHDVDGKISEWLDGEPIEGGVIIGVVDLVDVHHGPEHGGGCHKLNSPLPVLPTYAACSEWGEAGAYHLVLANPRPLDEPILYRGMLGLRRFNETVDAGILRTLEALS